MKLIIAIVQDDYITKVVKALMDNKIRATKLSSTGGFLKSGNTTLFIGVEDNEVEDVIDLIKKECATKKIKDGNTEITLGGANLFVMDIDKYMKI
ncbi:cyclic-di-AMP receptor [Tissierella pigra]|uniref:Transcriptional regulator n=1 Tax=Tissierella pigra TaxID=2607614 RepID=A0A6N7XEP6_9FIRM|nr:cyclic-di-AMP receptor [Tissierella pigra]MBU5427996.1 cyclic-di-AMP receptor [Tissierella pigra]MSU00551.1 hypothetical protein [Tissierella pigra]